MSGQQSKQQASSQSISDLLTTGNSQNSFDQRVWGGNQKALNNGYNTAINSLQSNTGMIQAAVPGAQNYMNQVAGQAQNAWGNQTAGGAYKDINTQDVMDRMLTQVDTKQPSNMQYINNQIMGGAGNNYADAMKQQYMQDAQRAQNQMMSSLDARAAGSGMSGSSRHGVATALGMQDINQNLQGNLARTGYETFDKDLERKLGIAGAADQNTLARQQMNQQSQTTNLQSLMGMLAAKQGAMNQGLTDAQNVQGLGMGQFLPMNQVWQGLQNYGSAVGGPIVLNSGTGSSNTFTQGSNRGSSSSSGKSGGGGI